MSDPLRLRYPAQHPSPDPVPTEGAPAPIPSGTSTRAASTMPGVDPSTPTELDRARALMHQQQARSAAFAPVRALFHDPAWDILLGLFIAYEEGKPLTIDTVRATTGLSEVAVRRWLLTLEHRGLITCWPQTATLSERSLGLTDDALTRMLQFLQKI
ncbi:hypothetical protein U1737_12630 [Sphingomonas sp. LB3N6]|uniref:hypothetical protein n=1 Tax=Sphingomonas fucosidasi TaxID=3096164 RepID=UPI002FC84E1F